MLGEGIVDGLYHATGGAERCSPYHGVHIGEEVLSPFSGIQDRIALPSLIPTPAPPSSSSGSSPPVVSTPLGIPLGEALVGIKDSTFAFTRRTLAFPFTFGFTFGFTCGFAVDFACLKAKSSPSSSCTGGCCICLGATNGAVLVPAGGPSTPEASSSPSVAARS